jgi:hypothetical protein
MASALEGTFRGGGVIMARQPPSNGMPARHRRAGPAFWRRAGLAGFGARFAFYTLVALLPYWSGAHIVWKALTMLQAMWLCGALFAAIFALVREERADKSGFNLWHEALAFGALGALIHALKGLIA